VSDVPHYLVAHFKAGSASSGHRGKRARRAAFAHHAKRVRAMRPIVFTVQPVGPHQQEEQPCA
jgi:hypothetical protein